MSDKLNELIHTIAWLIHIYILVCLITKIRNEIRISHVDIGTCEVQIVLIIDVKIVKSLTKLFDVYLVNFKSLFIT